MEPVLGGRDDRLTLDHSSGTQLVPQWSPSLADGTTPRRVMGDPGRGLAAMEPVLGGRDDSGKSDCCRYRTVAAMEPVLGGRDDLRLLTR